MAGRSGTKPISRAGTMRRETRRSEGEESTPFPQTHLAASLRARGGPESQEDPFHFFFFSWVVKGEDVYLV